jgi:NAD(P)H dehydrogenase (quinone)
MTIVAVGATGNVGTPAVQSLLERGADVHVLVRDPAKAAALLGPSPRLRISKVSLADRAMVAKLMEPADAVFVALGNYGEAAELQRALIDAAATAGVRRFVRLAVLGTNISSLGLNQRAHAAIENYQASRGLPGTSVRASIFHTNVLSFVGAIRNRGEWFGSAGRGKQAFVDPHDVGNAVATLHTQPGDPPAAVDLPGPDLLSYTDVAVVLTRLLERTITYRTVEEGEFAAGMRSRGVEDHAIELLTAAIARSKPMSWRSSTGTFET